MWKPLFLSRNKGLLAAMFLLSAAIACRPDFEIDEALLSEVSQEVIPLVEKELDVELDGVVTFRLAEADELLPILRKELKPQLRVQFGEGANVTGMLDAYCQLFASSLMAKYHFEEKSILVCPENIDRLTGLIDEPDLRTREGLTAVLVHECVHAADDLKYDFTNMLMTLKTTDAIQGCNAVVEGHAQHRARRICKARGWTDGFEAFTRSIGKLPEDEGKDEAARLIKQISVATLTMAYYDGEKFMAAVHEGGGDAAVARAFREPPADVEIIHHPEWFLDPRSRPAFKYNFDAAFDLFARSYSTELWTHRRMGLTKPQMEAAMALLPRKTIDRVTSNVLRSKALVVTPSSGGMSKMIMVNFTEMTSPAEALFFATANEALIRVKDEKMKSGSVKILNAKYTPIQGEDWQGVYYEKEVEAMGTPASARGATVFSGSLALEMLYSQEETTKVNMVTVISQLMDAVREEASGEDEEGEGGG